MKPPTIILYGTDPADQRIVSAAVLCVPNPDIYLAETASAPAASVPLSELSDDEIQDLIACAVWRKEN